MCPSMSEPSSPSALAPEPPRFWTPGFASLMALLLAALVVLVLLGNWQLRRLEWKETLLATIEDRRSSPPAPIAEVWELWRQTNDVDYQATTVSGRFSEGEAPVYATLDGRVGWHILAPFVVEGGPLDGRVLVVNRGFVPDALRDPASRAGDPPEETLTLTGLARNPLAEKPNRFVPDNAVGGEEPEFYWRDYAAILDALEVSDADALPFLFDIGPVAADRSDPASRWPQGGTTIVDLPNNHLGYAATWYGIGLGTLGVAVALLWQRRKRVQEASTSSTGTDESGARVGEA